VLISVSPRRRPGRRAIWLFLSLACVWLASGALAPLHAQAAHEQPSAEAQHAPSDVKQGAVAEGHTETTENEGGWLAVVARLTNFLILVGLLTYFLKAPIRGYLESRGDQIRGDLVNAAETRSAAERELAAVETKMKGLPAEIDALRARGAAEIAAEEARIRAAAEAERARLLEHMHREMDRQVRVARRELMEEAAGLAVAVARQRILTRITPEDQMRLIDKYATQLGSAS
jgi:F0F1-type ATP synthase membrane subunit b/b'